MAITKVSRGLLNTGISDSSDATAITIDSSERVGIGTTSPGKNLEVNDSATPTIRFARSNSFYWDVGHTSSQFQFNSQTGGTIMQLNYDGNVGIGTTSPVATLQVKTQADGNLAFQNSTSVTGGVKLNCFNDAANASSPFEIDGSSLQFNIASTIKARIDSDGLKFGSDTAEANALDDYEEGTFTAGITGASGHAYSAQTATYTKIGRLVVANFTYVLSTAPTSGSNIYVVMPFVPTGSSTYSFGAPYSRISFPAGQTDESAIMLCTYAGTVNFYPYDRSSGAVYISYTNHAVGQYSCTVTYFTDS